MQGFVDTITETYVAGWAFETNNPAPVGIAVLIGGMEVASGLADLPRPDLERSHGRALAGFRVDLNLPEAMRAGFAAKAVRVFGRGEAKLHPLPRAFDLRPETPIAVDEMGSGFWMFGANLFAGLAVDLGHGAETIAAVRPGGVLMQSGREAEVAADARVTVVPEMFGHG